MWRGERGEVGGELEGDKIGYDRVWTSVVSGGQGYCAPNQGARWCAENGTS